MYETGPMGVAAPLGGAVTWAISSREGKGTTCLVPDKAPLVHLGRQVPRPLHVPRKQFGHLLRR